MVSPKTRIWMEVASSVIKYLTAVIFGLGDNLRKPEAVLAWQDAREEELRASVR